MSGVVNPALFFMCSANWVIHMCIPLLLPSLLENLFSNSVNFLPWDKIIRGINTDIVVIPTIYLNSLAGKGYS